MATLRAPSVYRHAGCGGALGPNREGVRICAVCGEWLHIGLAEPSRQPRPWTTTPTLAPATVTALWRTVMGDDDE